MVKTTKDIPIYFGKLTVVLVDDWKELGALYGIDVDPNLYDAVMFQQIDDEYIVAIKKISWSVIAHEIVHIVNAIFISCGVQLDRHNDEPQAYLTGWVANEIEEFLLNFNNSSVCLKD
jgi:hypothetical protein